ncbi:MAG: trimethylamine methyltransferase family protein [Dehalococcoidia bacterium]
MKINQTINKTPVFQVLTEDQCEQIYNAALDVVERTGGRFFDYEALKLLKDSDAVVTDDNLVRIPASMVEQALKSHPSKITLTGRNEKNSIKLERNVVNFGTGSDQPFTYDRETGKRRPSTRRDVAEASKFVDYLSNYDFLMSHGIARDVPNSATYDRHQFLAMIENCTKPIIVTAVNAEGLEDQWKMACLIRGNEKEFRLNPLFAVYIEPSSPLKHTREALEKLLFAADKGIPAVYTPCPSAGATSPATIPAMLVQSLAETLQASVLSYLRKPGMPLIMGGVVTILDMLTSAYSYGAPELSLASAAYTDVAKWLGIPMFSTGGCTDSKVIDEQAAAEATTSLFYAYLSGANLIHDVGYLDSGLTASLDTLVMCEEIIGTVRQIGKGICTEDDHLAWQVIDEVGPGGEYLTHDHTYRHWKEWFVPRLQDRADYDTWVAEGQKTMNDRVREETERILREYQPEPLDEKVHQEMKRILDEAEKRHDS